MVSFQEALGVQGATGWLEMCVDHKFLSLAHAGLLLFGPGSGVGQTGGDT